MSQKEIDELITRYTTGSASTEEVQRLEDLIERGEVDLTALPALSKVYDRVVGMRDPEPSPQMSTSFYGWLASYRKPANPFTEFAISWPAVLPRLALACGLLAVGFGVGMWLQPGSNREIQKLSSEVAGLREMMVLSLLEKESATERLRAVSLSSEIDAVSKTVIQALVHTLNTDGNVNVRLAALEALTPYARQDDVRQALVESIAQQQSPLVQVALAELMLALQEKSSVKELQRLLESERTPREVKKKIQETLNVMS